jgi:Ca2+ transporting ATPase
MEPAKTIGQLILDALEDTLLRILCVAAAVSLTIGIITEGWKEGWIEGASIIIAVVLIVTITATNDYMKEK